MTACMTLRTHTKEGRALYGRAWQGADTTLEGATRVLCTPSTKPLMVAEAAHHMGGARQSGVTRVDDVWRAADN